MMMMMMMMIIIIIIINNSALLRLRKVTAMRQLKADHSLTVKATKPKIRPNIQRKNKERLEQKTK
jgi:hypothetical protein